MLKRTSVAAALAALAMPASTAFADDLVYTPVNPSFGGNPFNSSHLLGVANAQNDYERARTRESEADQFIRCCNRGCCRRWRRE
jgi:curli production assembly/transport component CsgF